MIDTDKYEGHTPASWEWRDNILIHMKQQDSIDIIDIGNHLTPLHPSMNIKEDELLANLKLIADAPLLLAEVKRLRGQLGQAREWLWWCYDNERFGWDMDEQMWEVIGRLLGADTDHNDNEWSEEE